MLPREHSAIFSTFIKLPFVVKTFVLSVLDGRFRQVLPYPFRGVLYTKGKTSHQLTIEIVLTMLVFL